MLVEANILIIITSFLLGVIAGSYRSASVSSAMILLMSSAFCLVLLNQFSASSLLLFAFALLACNLGLMTWAIGALFSKRNSNEKNA